MTTTIETSTKTTPFPIFKGAIYNTSFANNVAFFGSDLVPTNTPTTFRVYYSSSTSSSSFPYIQRTNGTTVVTETLPQGGESSSTPLQSTGSNTFDFIVGPSDTINFIFPTGTTTGTVRTMIVIEVVTATGYVPIRQ